MTNQTPLLNLVPIYQIYIPPLVITYLNYEPHKTTFFEKKIIALVELDKNMVSAF